jgi:4-amino-4-deoxy-L-arabinose transferase-like glycosyltransferase
MVAPVTALVVRGDVHWRGTEPCPADWTKPDADDSAWLPVVYPWLFIWPRDHPGMPDAHAFWADTERGESCVRRHFVLAALPAEPALVHIFVDDDYELYINGSLVGVSNDHEVHAPGETYDVSSLLRQGGNVVAIKLIDWGGPERGVLFTLSVPDAPQEHLTFADIVSVATPWVTFAGVVALAGLFVIATRVLPALAAPWVRQLPAGVAVAATVVALVACQWLLQTGQAYSGGAHAGEPWAEWNWRQIVTIAGALVLLVVLSRRDNESTQSLPPPRYEWLAVVGILLLATFLRTVALDSVPMGFFQDEAINGIDAWKLLDGRPLEIWSDSIGGRPTLFFYILGAVLHVSGKSYMSLKIVPVTFGVASVLALYLLGRTALGPRPALWAAFLMATSWWHIVFSRMAWEVSAVPFFSAVGCALLLYGLGRCRHPVWNLIGAGVMLAAGLYTYAAYRAMPAAVLVFLAVTAACADRRVLYERAGALTIGALVVAALTAPLFYFAWLHPELYWRRYTDVSITKYMGFHGTPLPWLHQFGKGLLALNQRGDSVNLSPSPFLDPVTGAFLLFGMAAGAPVDRRRGARLLWAWVLTFLVLTSLTRDSPHITRSLGMGPPVILFAGLGAAELFARIRTAIRNSFLVPSCVAAVILFVTAFNAYEYFIAQEIVPNVDLRRNLRARVLCETVRAAAPAQFYWTEDLAYWAQPQCGFLLPGGFASLHVVDVQALMDTGGLRSGPHPVAVAVGPDFLDLHRDKIPRDANDQPLLDLPARPFVPLDREARPLFYLYQF